MGHSLSPSPFCAKRDFYFVTVCFIEFIGDDDTTIVTRHHRKRGRTPRRLRSSIIKAACKASLLGNLEMCCLVSVGVLGRWCHALPGSTPTPQTHAGYSLLLHFVYGCDEDHGHDEDACNFVGDVGIVGAIQNHHEHNQAHHFLNLVSGIEIHRIIASDAIDMYDGAQS